MVKVFRKLKSGIRRPSSSSRGFSSLSDDPTLPRSKPIDPSDVEGGDSSIRSQNQESSSSESEKSIESGAYSEQGGAINDEGGSNNNMQVVVYDKPPPPPPPLADAFQSWIFHADLLLKSKEMQGLLGSTHNVAVSALHSGGAVVTSAGEIMIHTACLPVTVPLNLATSAVGLVAHVAGSAARIAFGDPTCGESTSSSTPFEGVIHGILSAVPVVVGTAGRITQEVGSTAIGVLGPMLGLEKTKDEADVAASPRNVTSSGERSAEQNCFLDRLRLDIHLPDQSSPPPVVSAATPADTTKYLLRVDDLNVYASQLDPATPLSSVKATFIDLGKQFSDESLTIDALDQLIEKGLDFAGSNADANVALYHPLQDRSRRSIDWKPEGTTGRNLRKMAQQSIMDCYKSLEKNVLIWSGKYRGPKFYGSEHPVFLARAVVKKSPREFMNMLWDSSRTNEYNKYSAGRKDVVVIEDNLAEGEGGSYGAKVIKSQTKVPFTGLSVGLLVLMHARALEGGAEDGFVIVSRSLNSGMAGCHVGSSQRVQTDNNSELLLGVNIMRPVPGNPDLTDLISLSQVSTKMVPQFLAFKIGMLGVEDFFNNVRQ